MTIIRQKDKATWGFTADETGKIIPGVPTKNAEDMLTVTENEEANRGNGGGFPGEDEITFEYLSSLKKADLLDLVKEHGIELDNKKGTRDEVLEELKAYYELTPEN